VHRVGKESVEVYLQTAAAFTFEDSAIARSSRSADLEVEARVWFLQIAVFDEAQFGCA
jgi:hypothetical protein